MVSSYLSPKTAVVASAIVGRGLVARDAFAAGEIVSVKGGRLVDAATRATWTGSRAADFQVADGIYLAAAPADEAEFERVMMFLNHSCEPNVGIQGQIVFVALRDIAAGEELTVDYGTIEYLDAPMACRCGHATCRGEITAEDWRKPELRRKYGSHIAWHLLERLRREETAE
jgi:uncharacterized protein